MKKVVLKLDSNLYSEGKYLYRNGNSYSISSTAPLESNGIYNHQENYKLIPTKDSYNDDSNDLYKINKFEIPEIGELVGHLTDDGILFFVKSKDNNQKQDIIIYDLLNSSTENLDNIKSNVVNFNGELISSHHIFTIDNDIFKPIVISNDPRIIYLDCEEIPNYDIEGDDYFRLQSGKTVSDITYVYIRKITTLNWKILSGNFYSISVIGNGATSSRTNDGGLPEVSGLLPLTLNDFVDISDRLIKLSFTGTGIIEVWG